MLGLAIKRLWATILIWSFKMDTAALQNQTALGAVELGIHVNKVPSAVSGDQSSVLGPDLNKGPVRPSLSDIVLGEVMMVCVCPLVEEFVRSLAPLPVTAGIAVVETYGHIAGDFMTKGEAEGTKLDQLMTGLIYPSVIHGVFMAINTTHGFEVATLAHMLHNIIARIPRWRNLNTGRADFVRNGGESNPGPAKNNGKRPQRRKDQRTHRGQEPRAPPEEHVRMAEELAAEDPSIDNEKARDLLIWKRDFRLMKTTDSIIAFNNWVKDLDPSILALTPKVRCGECGSFGHTKCQCFAGGVINYDLDYQVMLKHLPNSRHAVERVNEWINQAIANCQLSSNSRRFCPQCGKNDQQLCFCHVVEPVLPLVIKEEDIGGGFNIHRSEHYDLKPAEKRETKLLNARLHLYLRSNMHVNYPSRQVKVEHLHKLRMKYYEMARIDPSELSVAEFNRDMLTEGKAADDEANDYLLAPRTKNTGFYTTLLILLVFLAILCSYLLGHLDPISAVTIMLFLGVWLIKRIFRPSRGYVSTLVS